MSRAAPDSRDSVTRVAETGARRFGGGLGPTWGLTALIFVQLFCVVFFMSDSVIDLTELMTSGFSDLHMTTEAVASLTLLVSVIVESRVLLHLLTRQRRLARAVTAAAGGLHDLVEAWFTDWGLTVSERDVAWLTLKGLSISEVASIRGSAEGTVKAHLAGVYRKAGLQGRNALLSLVVEELMAGELLPQDGRGLADRADGAENRPV